MAKLVSFNSLDGLFEIMRPLVASTSRGATVTLAVLGARGQFSEAELVSDYIGFASISYSREGELGPENCRIAGYTFGGNTHPFTILTSSNFSTYFPSGVCLLSDPLLKEVA